MKVKELLAELQKADPEAKVVICTRYTDGYYDATGAHVAFDGTFHIDNQ